MDPEETRVAETEARQGGLAGAQVALAVIGLAVVAVALWFFFLRGGGEEAAPEAQAPPPATEPGDLDLGEDEPDGEEPGKAPETFEVFAPKDPFEPLVDVSAEAGAGTDTGGTTDTGDTGATDGTTDTGDTDGTDGTDGADGTDGTDGGPPQTTDGQDTGGHTVRLQNVFVEGGEERAQVQVDGTVYTVSEGERFADSFELVSVDGSCATMLFGDDEFTLCEGEEIIK
jgi:hypothetical protein